MTIAGDFNKHGGYGTENSWLFTKNPERYLLKEEHLSEDKPTDWLIAFILEALKADIPNIILEIPWMKEGNRGIKIKRSQCPIVYYKEPKSSWGEASYLCEITWSEIPEKWNEAWFKEIIRAKLSKKMHEASKKESEAKRESDKFSFLLQKI
jgi:hypothetical protein